MIIYLRRPPGPVAPAPVPAQFVQPQAAAAVVVAPTPPETVPIVDPTASAASPPNAEDQPASEHTPLLDAENAPQ